MHDVGVGGKGVHDKDFSWAQQDCVGVESKEVHFFVGVQDCVGVGGKGVHDCVGVGGKRLGRVGYGGRSISRISHEQMLELLIQDRRHMMSRCLRNKS